MYNYCEQPPTTSSSNYEYYGNSCNKHEISQKHADSSADNKPVKREKRKYRCRIRSPEAVLQSKRIRRSKANARERKRMHSLNDALDELRRTLPHVPDEPKLTKIETLRLAYNYIYTLAKMLNSNSEAEEIVYDKQKICKTAEYNYQASPCQIRVPNLAAAVFPDSP
uniref:BHLH domain-containing protein n=1 Tax=Syphacia muris TaxID=451379 RepID=A0A0N5AR41_9BILA